jgi:hypothetical protein
MAVQCVLDGRREASTWPAWLRGVLPELIHCLQAAIGEDAEDDDAIADLYGVSESPCSAAARWRRDG